MVTRTQEEGFTLIELLVVIAIISILATILLPSLSQAKESAHRVVCANNMKAQGLAFQYYVGEFNSYPPSYGGPAWGTENNWKNILINQGNLTGDDPGAPLSAWGNDLSEAGLKYFECPGFDLESAARRVYGDYVYNRYFVTGDTVTEMGLSRRRPDDIQVPMSSLAAVVDGWALEFSAETQLMQWAVGSTGRFDFTRHTKLMNALFCDGHVEGVADTEVTPSMFKYK